MKTIGGKSIENYWIDLARAWGVGAKDKDNGVLLTIAYNDHKLRIDVGRGLEGTLTDLQAGRIISEQITPACESRMWAGPSDAGRLRAIRQALGDARRPGTACAGELFGPTGRSRPQAEAGHEAGAGVPPVGDLRAPFGLSGSLGGGFGLASPLRLGGGPIFWGGGFGRREAGAHGFGGGGGWRRLRRGRFLGRRRRQLRRRWCQWQLVIVKRLTKNAACGSRGRRGGPEIARACNSASTSGRSTTSGP